MQGHLLRAYPPNAKRPRFNRMVSPTLSKMLTTIQNRQPYPTREVLLADISTSNTTSSATSSK